MATRLVLNDVDCDLTMALAVWSASELDLHASIVDGVFVETCVLDEDPGSRSMRPMALLAREGKEFVRAPVDLWVLDVLHTPRILERPGVETSDMTTDVGLWTGEMTTVHDWCMLPLQLPDRLDAKMEHAVFRAGRANDAGPGCITRWLPAALAREARRIRAIADDGSTTPCGVMFEESDSVVEKLIEGIRPHPCVYDTRELEYRRPPYRVDDFREAFERLKLLGDVASFGAYQMNHVWLATFHSTTAKDRLLASQELLIKGKRCILIDPKNSEIRLKIHWVP
ncbi:hypothetical protein HPB47_000109 [Ixodes persulcatus]|uniref:Uncharacterized protein n=1 Tax=Ixodes persulcatus TaxID=34615 RepID=A0AC60PT91_IXOPE|nr:hypothetical protein HPB47_000109 [Ixodes persulcatus]